MNEPLGLLLGECNAVNHDVRTKTPKISSGLIELVSIPMNKRDALWQAHGTGSAMKYRHLMPEREQPVGNRKSEEAGSPKDQHTQGFSLPLAIDPRKTPIW